MKMIHGIPNRGNTCYAASLIQCLRRVFFTEIDIDWGKLSGHPEDPHEFYMWIVDRLPPEYRNMLIVKTKDGPFPYISVNDSMESLMGGIESTDKVICLLRSESPLNIFSCTHLANNNKHYILVGCICYTSGHFYSVILDEDKWYLCDDMNVTPMIDSTHKVRMLFYLLCEPK